MENSRYTFSFAAGQKSKEEVLSRFQYLVYFLLNEGVKEIRAYRVYSQPHSTTRVKLLRARHFNSSISNWDKAKNLAMLLSPILEVKNGLIIELQGWCCDKYAQDE